MTHKDEEIDPGADLCSWPPCDQPRWNRTRYCQMHYARDLRGADMDVPPHKHRRPADGKCTYPGCEREWHAKGYCSMHLKRLKMGTGMDDSDYIQSARTRCSITGCVRYATKKGMCNTHYQRHLRGVNLEAPIGMPLQPLAQNWASGGIGREAAARHKKRQDRSKGLMLVYRWDRKSGNFVLDREKEVTRKQAGVLPKKRITVYVDDTQLAPVVRTDSVELLDRFDLSIAAERLERWGTSAQAA